MWAQRTVGGFSHGNVPQAYLKFTFRVRSPWPVAGVEEPGGKTATSPGPGAHAPHPTHPRELKCRVSSEGLGKNLRLGCQPCDPAQGACPSGPSALARGGSAAGGGWGHLVTEALGSCLQPLPRTGPASPGRPGEGLQFRPWVLPCCVLARAPPCGLPPREIFAYVVF